MSRSEALPRAPAGTRGPGRALWTSVVAAFVLDEPELVLLREAVRTVDLLDLLDAEVREHGPMVAAAQGQKVNPAAVEARAQRIALARLLAALRLPLGDDGDVAAGARPQRRVGVRGTYGVRGVS